MRRFLSLAILLTCFSLTASAQTFVNEAAGHNSNNQADVQSAGITTTAGNFIWGACIWSSTGQTISTVADGIGNTFTPIGSVFSANGRSVQLFYKYNITAGTSLTTCTLSAAVNAFKGVVVLQYSGMTNATPLDQTSTGSDASGTTGNCGSMTTTTNNQLIAATSIVQNTVTGAGASYNIREDSVNFGQNGALDRIVTSTASYSPTFTMTSGQSTCAAASFKADNLGAKPPGQFPRVVGKGKGK